MGVADVARPADGKPTMGLAIELFGTFSSIHPITAMRWPII
ncbi:hypothetical protein [uncultured Novosphingobium sp.]